MRLRQQVVSDTSRPTTRYGTTTLGGSGQAIPRLPQPVLTLGSGVERGRVWVLRAGENRVGRSSECEFTLAFRGVSRHHATVELSAAGLVTVVDSSSTNGTYVNDLQVERAVLSEGDVVRFGPEAHLHLSWHDWDEVRLRIEQYELSTRDSLTGLANRRFFETELNNLLARVADEPQGFGVVLFDLDHFKLVNDAFGHAAGDLVLCEVARRVDAILRGDTHLSRYGGEEFALLLRDSPSNILTVAERIRAAIESLELDWRGTPLKVTASLGVVTADNADDLIGSQLVEMADKALYRAKGLGRNQVCSVHAPPSQTSPHQTS
ncbi:MAG: GGDEF domain-containing protein [Pseudomonadota bacterium]